MTDVYSSPHPDDARRSVEHLFFKRPSRRLFYLFRYRWHPPAHIGWGPCYALSSRTSPSVLPPTSFSRPIRCTHTKRLAYSVGGVGSGDTWHDPPSDVAPKADRFKA